MYQRFLAVADKKQEVLDEDLLALVHDELPPVKKPEAGVHAELQRHGSDSDRYRGSDARERGAKEAASIGDGPVDAVYKAISAVTGTSAKLMRYDIRAVTSGTEALGEVTVELEGRAADYRTRRFDGRN